MYEIPRDDSILRIRQVLLGRLESLVLTWAFALGIGVGSLRDWVDGVVGEAIAIAIDQQDKWNPEKGDFLHWVFLKAKRLLRKEFKSESRYRRAQQKLMALAPHQGQRRLNALRDDLLEVLEALPLEHQQALVLYYIHGMTVPRLAEVLDKNPSAVYGLLERARKKAQKLWKGVGQPPAAQRRTEISKGGQSGGLGLEEDRRRELELREFVSRVFGLADSTTEPLKTEGPEPLSSESKGERDDET